MADPVRPPDADVPTGTPAGPGDLTFARASELAASTRELYRRLEDRDYGRQWDLSDLFTGFVGDVGDLAQLLGAHQGVRPAPDDLAGALAHELADCLWSLFVIADELGVDLSDAYVRLAEHLEAKLTARLDRPAAP